MPHHTTEERSLGPGFTPPIIRWLITLTASISILAGLTEELFYYFFQSPGPQALLSLSLKGLSHLYLWQPVSYLFVYGSLGEGITFWWLLGLFFNLYILWVMGSYLIERLGSQAFLRLYFLSGVSAGLITLGFSAITGMAAFLSGPLASILAVLVVWAMMNPNSRIFVFLIFPLKAHTLVTGFIAILLLINLSNGDFPSVIFYLSGAIIGYLYAVMAWGLSGPYIWLQSFDRAAASLAKKFSPKSEKIIPINSKKSSDEQFMDRMLEKISQSGEGSLSWWERYRMKKISKRRAR